ncbi:class I SAM-dependent methyltransferase [Methanobrevibacter sp.]|uniref:class I SAM-dependent methyltransferase n=1 Tax=Methanobrevibacter sp. TaxID=66852 RepID=UPI0025D695FD|nr:class I SAM-dependent methyltransferase [Methanobrevibacter sp.]MBQ6512378.1 class I SAM-dependent methyltransferase [Methanobrevibacter sp.]
MPNKEKYLNNELLINARKPEGELGEKLIDMMNENHKNLAQWSVNHLEISKKDIILDIGCGGGVNVKRFLKMTDNNVYGIDYSDVAVKKSIELNKKAIEDKRCEIIKGSVSKLPFEDNSFDIITAFETVYFWPDFENDLKEVKRVLKDGGIIFIANEALPIKDDERQKEFIELLDANIYSEKELNDSLTNAGFCDIACFKKESIDSFTGDYANWICFVAKK